MKSLKNLDVCGNIKNMVSIDGIYEDCYIINKSKFFSFAYPVFSEGEVKEILKSLREKYSDATHICFAYSLSSPRLEKADDNGEPSGTAGKPMLELLKKKNLENVLIVVIRYFGGLKLGAGGLVRAYTTASNIVLDKSNVVEIKKVPIYKAIIDVSIGNKLQEFVRKNGGNIRNCLYSEKTTLEFVGDIEEKIKSVFPECEIEQVGSENICLK